MSQQDNRREGRFAARIVAKVVRRGETVELLTNDVSFKGAFLRTDAPPGLRQLVRVQFLLPNGGTAAGHAMVVHVVQPNGGDAVPGVGVQFWGPMESGQSWQEFIHDLRSREKAGVPSSRATDKVRRASERFKLALEVDLDGQVTQTRDISETGMAIRTALPMQAGMRISLKVKGGTRELAVDVIVRRRIVEPSFEGVGVEYVDLDPETKYALMGMLRPHADEDAVFVEVDDPELH